MVEPDLDHHQMQEMQATSAVGEELWDVPLFISSFDTVPDAFRWMGESSTQEIRKRMQHLLHVRATDDNDSLVVGPALPLSPMSNKQDIAIPADTRNLMVFDTETIGLSNPVVCQLAYIVVEGCKITTEYDRILSLPKGVHISAQAQRIHHISNEDCRTRGVDAPLALKQFAACAKRISEGGGYVVAHNAKFDMKALKATCNAWNMDADEIEKDANDALFCTMKRSMIHSPLVDRAGRKKAFRNDELYLHLHKVPPSWAQLHNALDDVRVTLLNYVSAQKRGWWR